MRALLVLIFGLGSISVVRAHAFVDHAEPKVGGMVSASPPVVKIWFTDDLNESLSKIQVFDAGGKEVDRKDVKIDPTDKSVMFVSVPKLAVGYYKVVWSAVCPQGHHTSGDFTFEVK